MASKRDVRQQKKREKQKKKREKARARRREKVASEQETSVQGSLLWPLGAAWASTDWHEPGAHVHVVISRRRDDGVLAAAFFEVDLGERGLLSARSHGRQTEERVLAEVTRLAGDEGMIELDPVVAAKIVVEGKRFGEAQGHRLPAGAAEALALIEDIDVEGYTEPIPTGRPQLAAPPTGAWGALKRWLFGGPRPAPVSPAPSSTSSAPVDSDDGSRA